jgi:hypothetical protein
MKTSQKTGIQSNQKNVLFCLTLPRAVHAPVALGTAFEITGGYLFLTPSANADCLCGSSRSGIGTTHGPCCNNRCLFQGAVYSLNTLGNTSFACIRLALFSLNSTYSCRLLILVLLDMHSAMVRDVWRRECDILRVAIRDNWHS